MSSIICGATPMSSKFLIFNLPAAYCYAICESGNSLEKFVDNYSAALNEMWFSAMSVAN